MSLSGVGLDSLMGVEMKNRSDQDLRISVPGTTLLEGPSVRELAVHLLALVRAEAGTADGADDGSGVQPQTDGLVPPAASQSPERILANIDQLSDADVDALLTSLLSEQGDSP